MHSNRFSWLFGQARPLFFGAILSLLAYHNVRQTTKHMLTVLPPTAPDRSHRRHAAPEKATVATRRAGPVRLTFPPGREQ